MPKVGLIAIAISLSMSLQVQAEHHGKKQHDAKACPDFLNQEYRQLHSSNTINLCDKFSGKPMVIVNTASHCGYTKQFGSLEKLYQKYKAKGVEVIGFASNDFNQAAKDEAEAAGICYKNYGVTFTMISPTKVKGKDANATFAFLSEKSEQPNWNFNKYLIADSGKLVKHYGSKTTPLDSELEKDLIKEIY